MPKIRTTPLPMTPAGTGKITISLTAEQAAAIDEARGSVPASAWVRDAALRAASKVRRG